MMIESLADSAFVAALVEINLAARSIPDVVSCLQHPTSLGCLSLGTVAVLLCSEVSVAALHDLSLSRSLCLWCSETNTTWLKICSKFLLAECFTSLFLSCTLCSSRLQNVALGNLLLDMSIVCPGPAGGLSFRTMSLAVSKTLVCGYCPVAQCQQGHEGGKVWNWHRWYLKKWIEFCHHTKGQWWHLNCCGYFCLRMSLPFQRCCSELPQAVVPPAVVCLSSPSAMVFKGNMKPRQ